MTSLTSAIDWNIRLFQHSFLTSPHRKCLPGLRLVGLWATGTLLSIYSRVTMPKSHHSSHRRNLQLLYSCVRHNTITFHVHMITIWIFYGQRYRFRLLWLWVIKTTQFITSCFPVIPRTSLRQTIIYLPTHTHKWYTPWIIGKYCNPQFSGIHKNC